MKKIYILVFLMLISFGITSCNSNTIDSYLVDIVESGEVIFTVEVDDLTLGSDDDIININVKIKALRDVSRLLPTSSYGEEGIILLSVIEIDNSEHFLYTNLFYSVSNDAVGGAYLNKGDTLIRTFQLYTNPINNEIDEEIYSPEGNYRVCVKLYGDEEWIETNIIISVELSN